MSDKYRPSKEMNKREINTIFSNLGLQPRGNNTSHAIGYRFTSENNIPSNNTSSGSGSSSVYDWWYNNSSQKN